VILLHEGRVLGHASPQHFSAGLKGHTFEVSSPSFSRRRLQSRLAVLPGIVDAVVQGEVVRVVTTKPQAPDLSPIEGELHCQEVPPRFEDSFVSRLQQGRSRPASTDFTPRQGESKAVIRVEGLERRFGDFYAVRNLSFQVQSGEVFGLLGANGAGKTTTFRMLCGLLPASGGQLQVAGHDLRHTAARARASIGYMSQKFSLYGHLSVCQNLQFFASAYGLRGQRRRARLDWALATFELEPYRDTGSSQLPLGYKQRLAMAAALMHEPQILFLDEPTSGVDPLARREFWSRINALAEAGVSVLVTTHFMEEAEYCDRLAIMVAGEILAMGTPAQVKAGQAREGEPVPDMEQAFIRLIEGAAA
jgi:ABC-2 type transport system ATP-binding protein